MHVLDASRAVGVVNALLNEQLKSDFDKKTREDYERLRREHAAKTEGKKLLTLEQARANRTPIDWRSYVPPKPEFLGVRVYVPGKISIAVSDLIEYIDWSPFFHAWELRGRYPAIFDDPKMGKQARELFDDAQELLERIAAKNLLIPRGVYAFWPANAVGDDVHVYADEPALKKSPRFIFCVSKCKSRRHNSIIVSLITSRLQALNSQLSTINSRLSRRIRGLNSWRG